jgi:hypothetical protein
VPSSSVLTSTATECLIDAMCVPYEIVHSRQDRKVHRRNRFMLIVNRVSSDLRIACSYVNGSRSLVLPPAHKVLLKQVVTTNSDALLHAYTIKDADLSKREGD